jgi:hypothetical protein
MSAGSHPVGDQPYDEGLFFIVSFGVYSLLGMLIALSLYTYKYYGQGLLAPADNRHLIAALFFSSTVGWMAASLKMHSAWSRKAVRSRADKLITGIIAVLVGAMFAGPLLFLEVVAFCLPG